jgi:hypothetical protein
MNLLENANRRSVRDSEFKAAADLLHGNELRVRALVRLLGARHMTHAFAQGRNHRFDVFIKRHTTHRSRSRSWN